MKGLDGMPRGQRFVAIFFLDIVHIVVIIVDNKLTVCEMLQDTQINVPKKFKRQNY